MDRNEQLRSIELKAPRYRIDIIEMLTLAGSGHPGGSLSAIDMISTLYHYAMRHRPEEPSWAERDRFVLSKGHGVPAQYAVMADCGYFPREELWTLRQLGSRMQGHPCRHWLPGVDASTGSLGQGLSMAQGMAMAARLDGSKARVYCMLGDGELQEGQVWEGALSAAKYRLDGLTAIVDYNKGQIDGLTRDVMNLEPLADKWAAFGWHVVTIDGHAYGEIAEALDRVRKVKGRPSVIIAHTKKGKGVSFMEENLTSWHGVAPSREQADRAIQEIRGRAGLAKEAV